MSRWLMVADAGSPATDMRNNNYIVYASGYPGDLFLVLSAGSTSSTDLCYSHL